MVPSVDVDVVHRNEHLAMVQIESRGVYAKGRGYCTVSLRSFFFFKLSGISQTNEFFDIRIESS
jgi:hypothetical protein